MLITLSRRTAICQSVAEVWLTGMALLRAVNHRLNFNFFKYNNNHLWCNSVLRLRVCQRTAGLTSICPQTEVNNHDSSLRVTVLIASITSGLIGFLDQSLASNQWHRSYTLAKISSPTGEETGAASYTTDSNNPVLSSA